VVGQLYELSKIKECDRILLWNNRVTLYSKTTLVLWSVQGGIAISAIRSTTLWAFVPFLVRL